MGWYGTFARDRSLESNNLITIVVNSKIDGGHLELASGAVCVMAWWGCEGKERASCSGKYIRQMTVACEQEVEPGLSRGHVIAPRLRVSPFGKLTPAEVLTITPSSRLSFSSGHGVRNCHRSPNLVDPLDTLTEHIFKLETLRLASSPRAFIDVPPITPLIAPG